MLLVSLLLVSAVSAPDPCAFAAALPERFGAQRSGEQWKLASPLPKTAVVVGSDAARAVAVEAKEAAAAAAASHHCVEEMGKALTFIVVEHHQQAQKKNDLKSREIALDFYDAERALARTGPDAYRLGFFRAELLFDLGRWSDAVVAYRAVADADPKGGYTRTCAYNETLAAAHLVGTGDAVDMRSPKPPYFQPKPTALTPAEEQLVKSSDHYLKLASAQAADPKLVDEVNAVTLRAAVVYLNHDQPEGLQRVRAFVDEKRNDPSRCEATQILLDGYLRMDREGLQTFLDGVKATDPAPRCGWQFATYRKALSAGSTAK